MKHEFAVQVVWFDVSIVTSSPALDIRRSFLFYFPFFLIFIIEVKMTPNQLSFGEDDSGKEKTTTLPFLQFSVWLKYTRKTKASNLIFPQAEGRSQLPSSGPFDCNKGYKPLSMGEPHGTGKCSPHSIDQDPRRISWSHTSLALSPLQFDRSPLVLSQRQGARRRKQPLFSLSFVSSTRNRSPPT